ncbi:hypothetical protein Ddye_002433 [Dipteronia dyeriana]|uniref:Uncharacterized protein n=1 Tax=Dipteronia dyeriana TaxID=168575 RepID=A0AAD9XQF5_9ROSI|nr:hypothetical protein Ddye_002433 [Dipteronia dyeriana]
MWFLWRIGPQRKDLQRQMRECKGEICKGRRLVKISSKKKTSLWPNSCGTSSQTCDVTNAAIDARVRGSQPPSSQIDTQTYQDYKLDMISIGVYCSRDAS